MTADAGDLTGLDASELMATACTVAGLDDYGDDAFVEPLSHWLSAVNAESRLSMMGTFGLGAHVVRLLVNRLRIQADVTSHPEILDEDVSDPIVIIGLARTGTTKLQRMLSADPSLQSLPFWRVYNPGRLSPDDHDPAERIKLAEEYVGAITSMYPVMMAAHPTSALEADEDTYLLELTFDALITAVRAPVPSFYKWWRERPRTPTYQYERTLLQCLQWQDGGRRGRRWVLKSPVHLGGLDALLEVFPGATFVHCHRDPGVAMPSTARMLEVARMLMTDTPDLLMYGDETIEWWAEEMDRHVTQRAQLGDRLDVVDVVYRDIVADPFLVIGTIYRANGLELTTDVADAMRAWEADNPQNRHGKHEYSLERYGLTRPRIEAAFASYLDRFGVPIEP